MRATSTTTTPSTSRANRHNTARPIYKPYCWTLVLLITGTAVAATVGGTVAVGGGTTSILTVLWAEAVTLNSSVACTSSVMALAPVLAMLDRSQSKSMVVAPAVGRARPTTLPFTRSSAACSERGFTPAGQITLAETLAVVGSKAYVPLDVSLATR